MAAGLIDEDYRGDIVVMVRCTGDAPIPYVIGQAIAQLVVVPRDVSPIEQVQSLDSTARGAGGVRLH